MIKRWWHRWSLWIWFTLAVSIIVGCQATPQTDNVSVPQPAQEQTSIVLNGTGASFPLLFYERIFSEYRQNHPEVLINYQATGSAAGVQQLITNTVDFAASDVAMTDEEIAQVAQGVVMIPMTAGSVAIAYNLPIAENGLKLSPAAYSGIFLGDITQWNDPLIAATNPDLDLPDFPLPLCIAPMAVAPPLCLQPTSAPLALNGKKE
jgi:phosphate transport system substrate-binding protein